MILGLFAASFLVCTQVVCAEESTMQTTNVQKEGQAEQGVVVPAQINSAEPLTLEQVANVEKEGQMELGITDISYGYQKYTTSGVTGENTFTDIRVPLFVRYGIMSDLEIKLLVPYRSTKFTTTQIGVSESSNSGLGQVSIGLKYNLIPESDDVPGISISASSELPTADAKKYLGTGTNVYGTLIIGKAIEGINVNLNAGYGYTGEFTNASDAKQNNGDVIYGGLAIGCSIDEFTPIIEISGTTIGKAKVSGTEYATNGNTFDAIAGLRYKMDDLKLKLGFVYALGDATYTSYTWKAIGGATYLFNL